MLKGEQEKIVMWNNNLTQIHIIQEKKIKNLFVGERRGEADGRCVDKYVPEGDLEQQPECKELVKAVKQKRHNKIKICEGKKGSKKNGN